MPRFFFRLPWWRAILETLLLGGALWCILFVFHQQAPITSQEAAARPEVLSLMLGPVCMLWCAIRLRMPDGPWWRRRLLEACVYGCVGGVLAGIVVWIGNTPFVLHTRHSYVVATFAVLAFFLNCTVFILSRIGLRLLLFWRFS